MPNDRVAMWKIKRFRDKIYKSYEDAKKNNKRPKPVIFGNKKNTIELPITQDGVGTELYYIFNKLADGNEELLKKMKLLNFDGSQGCGGCFNTMKEMNSVGPKIVRENKKQYAKKINTNRKNLNISWTEIISKSWKTVLREGLPWTLEGLIEEACKRYEEKTQSIKENS